MSSKTIATILTMQDKMSPKLFGVSKNVAGMSKEMQRAAKQSVVMANKFGKNMMGMADKIVKTTAKFAVLGTLAAAGIIFKVGIEGLKELDEASAKVKSIAGSALEKKDIKKGLLKTSNATGITTSELGDTQYNAISSGVKPNASLEAALVSAKLAKAGFTDSNSALKVLMSTMNVYGKSGTKAMQSISDKMLIVQNLGVTTVAELAEGMGSVTPIAKAAGASIDELDAGMIALTKNGIKTDEAAVQLKGMFTSIIAPSKESADMAKSLGLEFNAAALKSKGFAKFMADVRTKTGGSTEKMAGLFGNVRALTGALVLSGSGFKDFNSGLVALKNSSGATDTAFEIMENTIGAKMAKLKNRFKNTCTSIVDTQSGTLGKIADSIGKGIVDNEGNIGKWTDNVGKAMVKIFDAIKKVIDFMIEHKTTIENFGIAFISFYIAVKAVSALKLAMDGLKLAIVLADGAMKMTTFGWITIGVAIAVAAFIYCVTHLDKVKAAFATVKKAIEEHKVILGIVAGILTAVFGPALVTLTLHIAAQTIVWLAHNIVMLATKIALGLATAAQWLFNAAMSANPIGIVIIALAALGLAIYEVVTHWKSICTWIGNTGGKLKNNPIAEFIVLTNPLLGVLFEIAKHFDSISSAISKAFGWLTQWNGTEVKEIPIKEYKSSETKSKSKDPIGAYINTTKLKPKIKKTANPFSKYTKFAKGGIATQPSIFGEAGAEIAIPLKHNAQSRALVSQADIIVNGSKGDGKTFIINNYFSGNVGTEEFFDECGNHIVGKIKLQLTNM